MRRSAKTGFRKGDRVIVIDGVRPPQYRGKVGTVRIGDHEGEVGVQLGRSHHLTWFHPHELERGTEASPGPGQPRKGVSGTRHSPQPDRPSQKP